MTHALHYELYIPHIPKSCSHLRGVIPVTRTQILKWWRRRGLVLHLLKSDSVRMRWSNQCFNKMNMFLQTHELQLLWWTSLVHVRGPLLQDNSLVSEHCQTTHNLNSFNFLSFFFFLFRLSKLYLTEIPEEWQGWGSNPVPLQQGLSSRTLYQRSYPESRQTICLSSKKK